MLSGNVSIIERCNTYVNDNKNYLEKRYESIKAPDIADVDLLQQGGADMLQSLNKKRHMNGLDGLRAIAVSAVIAYHLNLDFIPGGLLGVGIFFVLSGYLITDILLSQWRENGYISLGDFWMRRIRRLIPGMLSMIAVVMIWLLFTDPSRLAALRGDVVSGVLYISNWWNIFHHVSYFKSFGPPSPFGHFWSLAVEEQFYIIWPLLLIAAIVLFKRKGWLVLFIVAVAALSACAMAILYNPDLDPSRVYYGTDTRAFALLAGAALAVVWPSRKLSFSLPGIPRLVLDVLGLVALAVLIYMLLNTSEYDPSLYRGGMVLQAIATTLLVAVLAHPASILGYVVGSKPLRWIGERAYGLYLWHYPVIVLTNPTVDTGGSHPVRMILQVTATVVIASLSLKYIENPIRYHGFRDSWSRLWGRGRNKYNIGWKRAGLLMMILLPCFTVSQMMSSTIINSGSHSIAVPAAASTVGSDKKPVPEKTEIPAVTAGNSSSQTEQHTTQPDTTSQPVQTEAPVQNLNPAKDHREKYTVIGDSVILDAKPYLENSIPGVYVDGKIGRQMWQAVDVLDHLKRNDQLGSQVVLELGTNGAFNSKKLDSVLDYLKEAKHVYLVTVRVPRPWERTVNKALRKASSTYSNVSIIDWNRASEGHDDYFGKDGVHLTAKGSKAFTALIKRSMQ